MRQLYADMYRSTSTLVECTTLYLIPLYLNIFFEFHLSECQIDLQRVSVFFKGHSTAAAVIQIISLGWGDVRFPGFPIFRLFKTKMIAISYGKFREK